MSKPYVICHMMASVDGRILPKRWRPQGERGDLYERLHEKLGGQAWLVGRISGQEFAKAQSYPADADTQYPREAWIARPGASAYGVVLDADGKIAWGRSDVGGDPIIVVLTEKVSDAHLGGLRADGVSYIFAGKSKIDLRRALELLHAELGVERLLLEGGGVANGAFLREGLVDELSLIVWPAIDGAFGAPSMFHSAAADPDRPAPIEAMRLLGAEAMESGAVWLRYRLENA
jgi:riboflavin biosynthesis pyrimidine reductase